MLKPPAWKILVALAGLLLVATACSQAEPAPDSAQDLASPAVTDAPFAGDPGAPVVRGSGHRHRRGHRRGAPAVTDHVR